MTRKEKEKIVIDLKEKIENTSYFYITNMEGFDVSKINEFRKICYEKGVDYKVYKNTLIKKSMEESGDRYKPLFEVLKRFSGIMFSKDRADAPAKIIQEYSDKNPGHKYDILKAAFIDSDIFIGCDKLESLSQLKSKEDILIDIVNLLHSPIRRIINCIDSSKQLLFGILDEIKSSTNQ